MQVLDQAPHLGVTFLRAAGGTGLLRVFRREHRVSEQNTEASVEARKRALANAVQRDVAAGWRVESQTDTTAVMAKGKPINHLLHLVLSAITCGLWLFVWPVVWWINRDQHIVLNVDDYANVLRQTA